MKDLVSNFELVLLGAVASFRSLGVYTPQQWFWPGSLRLGLSKGTAKQVFTD